MIKMGGEALLIQSYVNKLFALITTIRPRL